MIGMHFHVNGVIAIAALLTIWLGIFYCMPLPRGPDRAMIGLVCFLAQTPRWICVAFAPDATFFMPSPKIASA